MKKILSFLLLLFSFHLMVGQNISGEAIYLSKKKSKFDINSTDERERAQAKRWAELHEQKLQLTFTEDESFYKEVPALNANENSFYKAGVLAGSGGFVSNGIYKNLTDAVFTEQREFLGKLFLVSDSIPKIEWNITKESKMIGEYLVFKATAPVTISVDNFKKPSNDIEATYIVSAWFTPQIPVQNGPNMFQGLPGLILEVHSVDTTILCTKIAINFNNDTEISPTKTGDNVSLDEYRNIVKKELKERKN